MRARQLEVFCTVMRSGTVTGAAAMLNISQPALSQILLHAEDQLGFRLFNRVKGRLVPTAEAEELYPEAERIFTELAGLRRRTMDMKEGRIGLVRMAASAPPAMTIVPRALARFRATNPQVVVRSQIAPMATVVTMLRDGDIALGVVMNDRPHHEIEVERIGEATLVCLLPEGHLLAGRAAIGLADLAAEPLISYRPEVLPGRFLSALAAAEGLDYAPAIEIDVSISALPFVQNGLGVAIVDGLLPWEQFRGIVVRPLRPVTTVPLAILTCADRPLTGAAEWMRDNLRAAWDELSKV